MVIAFAIVLFVISVVLMLPVSVRVCGLINLVVEQLPPRQALRVVFAYSLHIAYMVLISIVFIDIGHPWLMVFILLPAALGYIIQLLDKAVSKV